VPALAVSSAGDGVLVLQSELWATNSVLVAAGRECLICDPSIFPDELEEIAAFGRAFDRAHLLITHSDYDHTCGIPAFPDAIVRAGAGTAQVVADGSARAKLDAAERLWGVSWPGELRVDQVVAGGPARCGECEVRAIDVPGHAEDGTAFLVADRGLLLPGDYLSAVSYPHVLGSLSGAINAYGRLMATFEKLDVSLVVPGHGPALERREALAIGREDLAYLHALQEAAAGAVEAGASPGAAVIAAFAVAPPRPARPDFEAFGLRSANARRAVDEALSADLPAAGPSRP
jgi:hydroxyacylglutathione hydrolase